MSKKQRDAEWSAFERGQDDVRDRRRPRNNPYPTTSPYYDLYEQGYDAELAIGTK